MAAGRPALLRPRILASTTSHKREPLMPTLEVFGKLGLTDVDLNLHHILEAGVPVEDVRAAARTQALTIWGLAGGWCDFFHAAPDIDRTFASIDRQVAIAGQLDVTLLRLFFGRLELAHYSPAARDRAAAHIAHVAGQHPHMTFVFENHDGASLRPEVCREILEHAAAPNARMMFDPINFAKAGVDPAAALRELHPRIAHVHLKGLANGRYCEFGQGDVDLSPSLDALMTGGYTGSFSVEYEGHDDGTLRLYRSVQAARREVAQRER
jgi:sugar phosphate isomerase/epimerase